MTSLAARADNSQTLTINGQTVNKVVTKITFNGDNVTLAYSDNSSQTEEMSLVAIDFSYTTTGISAVNKPDNENNIDAKVYNLNGQYVSDTTVGLPKGVYIVKGKKFIIK